MTRTVSSCESSCLANCSPLHVKLPVEIEARCDCTISVISSSTFQDAHVLLYGGQHKWAQQTIAKTTLMILFESGEREMTITDYAVITDAIKWNNHILHLQRLDSEMSNTLSSDDLGNLELALTEFLEKLKGKGVDIKSAKAGQLTKKEVVECLDNIGEHHYASLLRKGGGVQEVLSETMRLVHEIYLKEYGGKKILPVYKIVLCGVPRSGKTLFWNNLVKKYKENIDSTQESEKTSNGSERSVSTKCAEPHYLLVTLADWYLCKEEFDGITEEAYEIYKRILENVNQQQDQSQTPSELSERQNDSTSAVQLNSPDMLPKSSKPNQAPTNMTRISPTTVPTSDKIPDQTANPKKPDSEKSEIQKVIDSIFKALEEGRHDSSTLKRVETVISLIDTGGQSAFLHLFPLVTVGNALYLIFFSCKDRLTEPLSDKFVAEDMSYNLDHKFTQIDVILQVLRCVSTTADNSNSKDKGKVKALLVGTHKDKKDVEKEDYELICEKVEPFLSNNVLQCVTREPEELVLRVSNTEKRNEFETHRDILKGHFKTLHEELAANWLLFSVIIRQLQKQKKAVLPIDDCKYIANKLFIFGESNVKNLLLYMYDNVGVLMYFPHHPVLSNIVICAPSVIFECVSKMIIATFNSAKTDKEYKLFKKCGIFAYKGSIFERTDDNGLEHETLVILLQHIGAIAPIEYEPDPKFECPLCTDNRVHVRPDDCIHEKYILPCVLADATDGELLEIEQKCLKNCTTIAPLVITFDGGYTPVGGFCYLFTKLVADKKKSKWEPNLPKVSSVLHTKRTKHTCIDYRSSIYRNKFTIHCDGRFYITLLSRDNCYKVFVESGNEDDLECKIYYQVWTAIKDALKKCANQAIRDFMPAFECTCPIEEKHFMEVTPMKLEAVCQLTKDRRRKKEIHPTKYSAWFRELELMKEPLKAVQPYKPDSYANIDVICTKCGKKSKTNSSAEGESSDPSMEQSRYMDEEVKCYSTNDIQLEVKLCPCLPNEKDSYTCQWYRDNDIEIWNTEDYDGVNTPILTIKNLRQDYEGEYYCKVTVSKSSPISSKRAKLTIKKRLTENDHRTLLEQLHERSAKWREIGSSLGFRPAELDVVEASPIRLFEAPRSWLSAMLAEWLEWAPGDSRGSTSFATLEDLKTALSQARLGATAHDLKV